LIGLETLVPPDGSGLFIQHAVDARPADAKSARNFRRAEFSSRRSRSTSTEFLGMGGKNVAVLPSDIKTDNNRLTLDRTKEQLQQMASYNLENRNTGAGSSTSPTQGGRLGTGSSTTR
jgi:hypothetical protein